MDLQIGSTIGDYQILGVLGAGGMGSVYQVKNLISDRVEALKVLLPDLTADPGLAERFQREIKVLASLDHPNIAQFRNALRSGNQILMVMEYVDGVTLERKLHEGPLPVPLALDATSQVLAALEYAHARGIIHRDIKPANIFLTKAGVVKLMDFGIAKAATDHKLTSTGTAVGSLYYMSPEQIQGAATVDARSDLYSVGITLYQLVTGQRPFDGTSQFAIMSAHLEKPPVPPVALDPSLPQALNDLILMSVAKNPIDRFQTAGAFRSALAAVGATLKAPTEAVPAPPPAPAMAPQPVPSPGLTPPPPPARAPFSTGNPPVMPPVMPPPMAPPMAPPPPPMAATAPAPATYPQPSQAARPRSHRGLWMALGGIAAAAAIVCVIEFGPWKGAKADSARQQTAAITPMPVQPPPTAPVTPAEAVPTPPQEAAPQPAPKPDASTKPAPRPQESKPAPPPPAQPQPQPQPPAPQPEAQQPPPQPAVQPEPVPAAPRAPSRQELMRAREFLAKLHFRSDAINNILQSLQRRQEASGMGLNARFTRPQGLMNTYLESAGQALNDGDLKAAREYEEKAERQIETLEKLLNM